MPRKTASATTNADTLIDGIWNLSLNSDFSSYNYPCRYGKLISLYTPTDSYDVLQICFNYNVDDPNVSAYYRRRVKSGGTWSDWQRLDANIPSFYKSYSDLSSLASALGGEIGRITTKIVSNTNMRFKPSNIYQTVKITALFYKDGSTGMLEIVPSLYNSSVVTRYMGRLNSGSFALYYNSDSIVIRTVTNSECYIIAEGCYVQNGTFSTIDNLDGYTQVTIS